MTRYFGAHVSSAGGFENAIRNASELGVNTIQVHPSAPQRWNFKPYPEGFEDQFLEEKGKSDVEKVFFHAIYLINLATPDETKLKKAKRSLEYYLDLSARIQGEGVIVHVGSLKDESDEDVGFQRAADAIEEIMENTPQSSRLILEVAAGSGKVIGSQMEELQNIYSRLQETERVGFGLDSQHMWASGYDFQNNLDQIVSQVEDVFGLEKVWCVHFNDSKTELGSKKDRHENIGDGLIGKKALTAFLNHPKLREIPFVLETPALKDIESAKLEVEKVNSLLVSPD